mgnify:CR=1 FL=1
MLDLIRFNKPIGFMLLMWPCWFALAILPHNQIELINWYIYFMIGAFFMRSAGCIINDLVDINLDKKIERTAKRPLTSKKISILEASLLLFVLLFISLIILLQFKANTILIALISIPLVILYPYMKRFTYWPQFFLGLAFNWGVLIVSIEFFNEINLYFFLLYFACVFWTLGYDTIYAYQDRDDDLKNKIKSTAVLFGALGNKFVKIFYTIFFLIIGFLGYKSSGTLHSLAVIFLFIFAMILYLNKWRLDSKNSSNYYFRFNNFIGLFCFLFLLIF